MAVNLADWEDSKENVLPLRGGRDPVMLSEAFKDPSKRDQKLIADKQAHENAIKNDTSADPLDTWIRYIRWAQQSYTNGTKELIPLVERCADQFINDPMYKNDDRYIKVWIHYSFMVKEPLDVFGILEQRDIGIMVATYYEAKAECFVKRRRFKEATETYQLGIKRGAQPIAWLKNKFENFQARMAKRIQDGIEEAEPVADENAENRQALGALKTNKKGVVPSVRPTVKASVADASKKRKLPATLGNGQTSNFQVYEDTAEDSNKPAQRIGTGNWQILGAESTKYAENQPAPSKWNNQKIPQKKARSSAPQQIAFEVYEDPEEEGSTPAPKAEEPKIRARLDNPSGASQSKPVFIDPHKSETGDITGYNRALIFLPDGTELSFEEVRAAKYAYIEDIEAVQKPLQALTLDSLAPTNAFAPIPLAPITASSSSSLSESSLSSSMQSSSRPPLAAKRAVLAPRIMDEPVPSDYLLSSAFSSSSSSSSSSILPPTKREPFAPRALVPEPSPASRSMDVSLSFSQLSGVRTTSSLPPLGAGPSSSSSSSIPVFSTPRSSRAPHPSSHVKDSGGSRMNSTNFDLSFTASNISFTATGVPFSLSSPTINTRQALDEADLLLAGPSQPLKSQKPAVYEDEDDDNYDPNQENNVPPPANDENSNRGRLTNRDIIAAELRNKGHMGQANKVTNQYFIANQFNTSNLDITSELVDTEDLVGIGAPKMDGGLDFQIFEDATLSQINFNKEEEVAPARVLREIKTSSAAATGAKRESYNRTPNQSFNDSFSGALDLRRPTVRKIDNDFFDVSNTSLTNPLMNNNNNNNKPSNKLDFEIFEDNTENLNDNNNNNNINNNNVKFEIYSDENNNNNNNNNSNTPFNGTRSSLSLSSTSSMITPASHKSTFSTAVTPLTPLHENEGIEPYEAESALELMYQSVNALPNFFEIPNNSPECFALDVKKRSQAAMEVPLELEGLSVLIQRCVGEGGFASVYQVERLDLASTSNLDSNFTVALKVQSPPSITEFYIGTQIERRIPQNMKSNFMLFNSLHIYPDKSFLLMDFRGLGSLQDTINGYKLSNESADKKTMPESLVMYYTIEMLKIVETMHESGFIHGDIKPDNFLLRDKDNTEIAESVIPASSGLQLIDYGHSIDISLHSEGAVFTGPGTAAFKCPEMLAGLPWTYHIDTYGLCEVIHCLLHGSYMEVSEQNVAGSNKYRPKLPFRRYWQSQLWTQLFDQLLNLPSCHPRPSLSPLRQMFENYLTSNPSKITEIKTALIKRKYLTFEYFKTL